MKSILKVLFLIVAINVTTCHKNKLIHPNIYNQQNLEKSYVRVHLKNNEIYHCYVYSSNNDQIICFIHDLKKIMSSGITTSFFLVNNKVVKGSLEKIEKDTLKLTITAGSDTITQEIDRKEILFIKPFNESNYFRTIKINRSEIKSIEFIKHHDSSPIISLLFKRGDRISVHTLKSLLEGKVEDIKSTSISLKCSDGSLQHVSFSDIKKINIHWFSNPVKISTIVSIVVAFSVLLIVFLSLPSMDWNI